MKINPNYAHDITLYHLTRSATADTWTRTEISECSIISQIRQNVTADNHMATARSFTVRIPEAVTISEGDIIVFGTVTDTISAVFTATDLLKKYDDTSFQVRGINDNMRYYPPHIKVTS